MRYKFFSLTVVIVTTEIICRRLKIHRDAQFIRLSGILNNCPVGEFCAVGRFFANFLSQLFPFWKVGFIFFTNREPGIDHIEPSIHVEY